MKFKLFFSIAVTALLAMSCGPKATTPKPPVAKKIAKELTIHGDTRIDNYYWMNQREDTAVINYLKAENSYTDAMMKHTEEFQTKLFDEMIARIKKTDESVPAKSNGFYYYSRTEGDAEYPLYCRKEGDLDAEEQIMLNVPEMAQGYSFFSIGDYSVSENNKILAYSEDTLSRRRYTIKFKSLVDDKVYSDEIVNTTGGITWASDNKTVFYTVKHPETLLPYKVFKHVLGTPVEKDELVYEEKDNTFYTFCYKTKSRKYIIIGSTSTLSAEYRYIDASKPNSEFSIFQAREKDLEYSIDHFKGDFYIRTNYQAKNFRLMKTPVTKTTKENWMEVIPNRDDVYLSNFEIFENYLVVGERKNGLNQLRIRRWADNEEHYLDFGEETYDAWISTNPEFETDVLRYGYTSLTTPSSTIDYNMTTKVKTVMKQQEVVGDFDKSNYEAKRIWATAEDGTKVPVSLVYRKDKFKKGTNPLWLSAYGSYGSSSDVYFSSVRLSLLDRGFVVATAHVRGGQEMGRYWYEDGKLLKKKNTFTDFNTCAEYMVAEGYAAKDKVFAWGGSAGGLLMGAICNMRPDLYRGVIAAVPFVDVVTTMLDESIPLTTGEFDEWGNPKNKEYYDYMLSYSPYDNVEAKDYPAMLVTTGLHDSQVQYWEPAKWVAKLRDMKTDHNPLLIKINMDFGHGGASGRFERYHEVALEYAFVLDLVGITK
ncbi:S9 family peptidase [Labilibaculum euxinus]|uniref:Proline-specific endopeptidase n=1 Tax=Labilibaculum euxinus TaxID=2686357 RepID=A0A7M4D7K0_9BACT|nr:S9 family peptidase [Labilibaculum euxinus]MUP38629.1 prolyl oligopeptidase family serine peptidase [Labilibaculum euxinus]MVB07834.1 prolyl oligopeptidase family serine peptidase [Labilibaculum euxinus]